MKKCPDCKKARPYFLSDGRYKCRHCGRRFSWSSAWDSVRLKPASKGELLRLFVLGVPAYRQRFRSAVSAKAAIHLANVYQYSAADKTFKGTLPGPGGLSTQASELEGVYLWDWARATWADTLA